MFIKRPDGHRKTYSLVGNDGKTIFDPRIDAVNKDLVAGAAIDILEARMQAIKSSFTPKTSLSIANVKLVEACHSQKLIEKPHLVDTKTLKSSLTRAIRELGGVSVAEGSARDLLTALRHVTKPGSRYKVIQAINELLRYAGRDLRLRNTQPKPTEVAFIEVKDFIELSKKIPFKERAVLGALMASGARWGELPRMTVQRNTVHISDQIRNTGEVGPTKNKNIRSAPVLPLLKHFLDLYMTFSDQEKQDIRLKNHKKYLRASHEYLGLRLHDIRHCYAVFLAKKDTKTSKIALYIGDEERTCRDWYSRYVPSDTEIEDLVKRL